MTPSFHTLYVKDIRKETDDTVSVAFDITEELKDAYAYQSGQYLTLRTEIQGEDLRRSYSLCSSPFENEWRVAIKKVENGKFSSYANDSLKIGDALQVMTPMGHFTADLKKEQTKNYVFFAAGSGITPVISLIKTILREEKNSTISFFYGNKGFASIIFREEIEALKNDYLDRLSVVHVLSRESLGNQIQKGRIDAAKCEQLYNAFLKNARIDAVYSCGPEDMVLAVKDFMLSKGVDPNHIHFELFGTNLLKTESKSNNEVEVHANVQVIIDGDTIDIKLDSSGENILDAAQKAGGDLPFACKGGVCCTCKAKIIEGSARMDINYALEADEIEAGYILTCQAHPTSEKLVVSFDD